MRLLWPELAGHSWADLGLQSYQHHVLNCPKSQSCHLHNTTLQKLPMLLPLWAVVQQLLSALLLGFPQWAKSLQDWSGRVPSLRTSFRNPCLNDFCTRTFSSPTVEFCGSARVSPQPLGNETCTWSIACSGYLKTLSHKEAESLPKSEFMLFVWPNDLQWN